MTERLNNHLNLLQQSYSLTGEQIAFYRENAYLKVKQVFPPELIGYFSEVISHFVQEFSADLKPLNERDAYGKAFVQQFNLWRLNEQIKALVFSPRLAQMATELMGVNGVRLYHDQALFKEAGGGITPWHADQHYWPMATEKATTVWIPLQVTTLEMGALEFSAGSQAILQGRNLSIGEESEAQLQQNLKISGLPHIREPYDIGEVSFHSGWIFHRAGANQTDSMRKVMTVIYMDQDMMMKEPENKSQQNDATNWCPGISAGMKINSPLNPVLYSRTG